MGSVRTLLAALLLILMAVPDAQSRQSYSRCVMAHPPAESGHLIAEFTTHFKWWNRSRSANVRLAAQRLDGAVIGPRGKLSYNRVVGPRDHASGFRDAPVIARGKVAYKPGGGVCQPSSTLHAAALLGGLEIQKRKTHTWTSVYIQPGLDATVVYGLRDLVVRNPYAFTVRVETEIGLSHLTIKLVGDDVPTGWNELRTAEAKRRPHKTRIEPSWDLLPDEHRVVDTGFDGLVLQRTLKSYDATGKLRRSVRIHKDTYYPRTERILLGAPVSPELCTPDELQTAECRPALAEPPT